MWIDVQQGCTQADLKHARSIINALQQLGDPALVAACNIAAEDVEKMIELSSRDRTDTSQRRDVCLTKGSDYHIVCSSVRAVR